MIFLLSLFSHAPCLTLVQFILEEVSGGNRAGRLLPITAAVSVKALDLRCTLCWCSCLGLCRPAGVAVKCPLAQLGSEILVPSQNLLTGDSEDWLSWKPRLPWAPRGSSGNGSESDHCLQVQEWWLKAVISLRLINGCREAAYSGFLGKIGLGKGMSRENGNG